MFKSAVTIPAGLRVECLFDTLELLDETELRLLLCLRNDEEV